MKNSRVWVTAIFIVSLFAFSSCEEEDIKVENNDGEVQPILPVDHG